METYTTAHIGNEALVPITKPRYCLYARKSTEQDEKQALSIDSQIKEMLQIAEREGLKIIDIRREAHLLFGLGQPKIGFNVSEYKNVISLGCIAKYFDKIILKILLEILKWIVSLSK